MYKQTIIYQLLTITVMILVCGCGEHWDEKKKENFRQGCSDTLIFQDLDLTFSGYNSEDMDSIIIKEVNPAKSDTAEFTLLPSRQGNREGYYVSLKRQINKHFQYIILIKNDKPHLIKDFKTEMVGTFAIGVEDYECRLGEFNLDGKIENFNFVPLVNE